MVHTDLMILMCVVRVIQLTILAKYFFFKWSVVWGSWGLKFSVRFKYDLIGAFRLFLLLNCFSVKPRTFTHPL